MGGGGGGGGGEGGGGGVGVGLRGVVARYPRERRVRAGRDGAGRNALSRCPSLESIFSESTPREATATEAIIEYLMWCDTTGVHVVPGMYTLTDTDGGVHGVPHAV